MEADDSDFFLKFEKSLEKKRECFDLLQNVTASYTVVQLFSGGQAVSRSSGHRP